MKTQWVVASLVVLGLLAAVSAAILVAAMHFGARAPGPAAGPAEQAAFVVAARPLPAMAIVDTSCVTIKTAPRDQVPKDALPSPDSVFGKVLIAPLVEGQAFTSSCFAAEGTGPQLAGKLPNGMRAVMVPLPEHSSLEGLLYPGSIVDVLASLRRTTPSGAQTASLTGMDIGKMDVNNMDVNKMNFKIQTGIERFSTTFLPGVEVLAVDYQTVFSEEPNASPATGTTARRLHLVTLMLNQEQAKALQQAMEQGTVSLVLRNPEDRDPENRRAVGVLDVSVIRGGGQETELFEVNTGQKGTGRR